METWIRALCLIGIVAAPNVVEISEAWAEPKRQVEFAAKCAWHASC
jgi:hypothetical protein